MNKIIWLFVFLIMVVFFSACGNSGGPINANYIRHGGVVLTFDDYSIADWLKADSIYSQRGWKATFCITKFPELSEKQREEIVTLQNNGNEIGFHGTHHVNAVQYINEHSIDEYINYEILPGLNLMKSYGLNPKSFVYPYGVRDSLTDSLLFTYFSTLRGTIYGSLLPEDQKCFTKLNNPDSLVYGIGIDNNYEHMHLYYIYELLLYAFDNDEAVIFYGHKIRNDDTTAYVTSYHTLNFITDFVAHNKMRYYTLSEIGKKN